MDDFQIRPCVPEDASKAVPLIISSGPQAFDYVFKTSKVTPTDFLNFAFQRKGGEFSYDNHYAATLDDEVIGIGSIFNGKRASGFTLVDARRIMSKYKMFCFSVLYRGWKVERLIKLPEQHEACIAHLGIDPDYRGKGFGQQLIDYLIKDVDPELSIVLDVSLENPRAQALYERLGFKIQRDAVSTLTRNEDYVPSHYRMVLE